MPYGQKRVPIGKRRERIEIQQAVTTDDGMGGRAVTKWKTVGEPWAQVQALDERTKEALYAEGITARHAYHVVIPYRGDLSTKFRLIVRNTTMQIHSLTDDEGLRRRLVIQAGEIQA